MKLSPDPTMTPVLNAGYETEGAAGGPPVVALGTLEFPNATLGTLKYPNATLGNFQELSTWVFWPATRRHLPSSLASTYSGVPSGCSVTGAPSPVK